MSNGTNATFPSIIASHPFSYGRDPDMETWERILLAVMYSLLSAVIIAPNYLTLRALYTTKALMYQHKYLLGNLALADLAVGLVSVPAFIYNLMNWPTYGYLVYEGLDAWAGFASVFTLTVVSLQTFLSTIRPSRGRVPSHRSQCCLLLAIWFVAALVAALNIVCLLQLFAPLTYMYYFYVVVGFLVISGLTILTSCFAVMTLSCVCCKKFDQNKENGSIIKSVFIVMVFYILLWMLPYVYFIYSRVCAMCAPVLPAKFFYVTRMLLYLKSIVSPIVYIKRVLPFYRAVMRILTRECFAVPSG